MTPVQSRMARAALQLNVEELARRTAVAADLIDRFERGGGQPTIDLRVRTALETAGVEFLDEDGVRFHAGGAAEAGTVPLEALSSANDE